MSAPEDLLAWQLDAVKIPFEREVLFAKPRKWRADFVIFTWHIPRQTDGHLPLLIEIDGGTWSGGRHVTGSGHASDAAKRNAAVLLGYRPLTFSPAEVSDGSALATIEQALGVSK